jgi:hypothetical protein
MLDSHPALAVANDTHFIPAAIRDRPFDPQMPLTPDIVDRVREYRTTAGKGVQRLGLAEETIAEAAAQTATYADFVSRLYDQLAATRGKSLAGEKTPDYVRYVPVLHGLFPWATLLHLVRDGRDVALATLEWATPTKGPGRLALWREEPIAVCALWWSWMVRSARDGASRLVPGVYHEVRYEELVGRPAQTLRTITEFLELPFSDQMLAYHKGKTRDQPGLPTNKAWLPPTPGVRDWRKQMTRRDLELFEAIAGDLLTELTFERGINTISPEISEIAARYEQWWPTRSQPPQPTAVSGER